MTVEERLREWIAGAELEWRVLYKREPTDNSFAPMCIDLPRILLAELTKLRAVAEAAGKHMKENYGRRCTGCGRLEARNAAEESLKAALAALEKNDG